MKHTEVTTGQLCDPAYAYANAHLAKADQLAERVYRAKNRLLYELPRLTEPSNYVAARALAEVQQADALLTTANAEAFIAAVDAAAEILAAL